VPDRRAALRAMARRIAAERTDAPVPRPAGARIPLPDQHRADLAAGRTHRIRLVTDLLDVDRFAAALRQVSHRHDALRLAPVCDSGRWFLAEADHPVRRVIDPADLEHADPERPLRWWCTEEPGPRTVVLAVNAFLVDRGAWDIVLADVQDAYRGCLDPSQPELGHGDHCFWLAQRDTDGPDTVDEDLAGPDPEPLWEFADGMSWGSASLPVTGVDGSRADAVDRLCAAGNAALRACGWRGGALRARCARPVPTPVPLVGRIDAPPVAPSATDPTVHLDVDVLDLPRLRLDADVEIAPVLVDRPGWQVVLVRTPAGATLHVGGPDRTLPAFCAATAGDRLDGPPVEAARPHRTAELPRASRIVTLQRTLPADVVDAAVERRAAQLREAGLRPGHPLVVETTAGPETPANLLAGLRCRADVLLVDPDDPQDWRAGLLGGVPGAATLTADGRVVPAHDPVLVGDGDGALLVGLSAVAGRPVLARVPVGELLAGAAALGELWQLRPGGAAAADPAGAEDLAAVVLACAVRGADLVLVGDGGAAAVDLLARAAGCWIDEAVVARWAVPRHRIDGARGWRRATSAAGGTCARWWTAEAPATQWSADGDVVAAPGGRVVDDAGHALPDGTVGEIAVDVAPGSRYLTDPRRTADRLRPVPGGGRELRTGAVAGRVDTGVRLLRFDPRRSVVGNRTCLTDALAALVPAGAVAVRPPGAPGAEQAYLTAPVAVDALAGLPRPLADCVPVDPAGAAPCDPDEVREWASPIEELLAVEIVEPVLGAPVRRTDQLFSLGVTSIQLMRVLLQVNQRFGVDVPLARFFAAPTVAVLAELVELVEPPADAAAAALDVLDHFEEEGT